MKKIEHLNSLYYMIKGAKLGFDTYKNSVKWDRHLVRPLIALTYGMIALVFSILVNIGISIINLFAEETDTEKKQ
ncbi:hypothetical protein [Leptospira paudalimensis]|uniref:DUF2970 domain-containing protein n=1 Tax=Leptospira paudalimensis TaxID=2950024 RepID=A0ABT3M685_9LEPT|nr:hypothetical protein [Leptospira paudalimensis]MCW7503904.1 hypothetical protein [Leptospira paudalimensis]